MLTPLDFIERPLKFSFGNKKLPKSTMIFALPAGITCPGASLCKSWRHAKTGKIVDGPDCEFRCYAASQEVCYPNVAKKRQANLRALQGLSISDLVQLFCHSIDLEAKRSTTHFRWFESGDAYCQELVQAMLHVADTFPDITFYSYSKALQFWLPVLDLLPDNFKLTASYGGKHDVLIDEGHFPRSSRVVFSEAEAASLDLVIDHDDTHAWDGDDHPFALLIHGTQPKGSNASKALQALKA
jgi:hypothetical protein